MYDTCTKIAHYVRKYHLCVTDTIEVTSAKDKITDSDKCHVETRIFRSVLACLEKNFQICVFQSVI